MSSILLLSFISNRYLGEGVITKGTLTAVAAYGMPKILKIPFIPPVLSAAAATGLTYGVYYGGQTIIDKVSPLLSLGVRIILQSEASIYLKFLPVIGITLCALLYKRGGKVFSKGGFASLKEYLIPVGVKEESLISFKNRAFTWMSCCTKSREGTDENQLTSFLEDLQDDQKKEVKVMVSLGNKYFKDRITGKRPKNDNFYEIPLCIQKIAKKYFFFQPDALMIREHPMKPILEDEKGKLTLTFNASDIHEENEDREIQAKVKFESEKFSGKYVKLTNKDLKKMHLARLKGEKIGKWAEIAFISCGVVATFVASYSTKQIQLMNVTHSVQIPTEKLGEGVVTSIFNSVLATQMKQMGKQIPPVLRYGGGGLAWIAAVTLERSLLIHDMLPFLFAGVFASAFMGPMGKHSKDWVFRKVYGKTPGYITTNWPTDKGIGEQKNKIFGLCGSEDDLIEEQATEILEEVI